MIRRFLALTWLSLGIAGGVIAAGAQSAHAQVRSLEDASAAVVLAYARFGDDTAPAASIRLDQFDAHLRELRSGGYTVLPLGEVLGALREGRSLPPRSVVITIDEGHRSAYREAWPRLREAGLPFTVFVASDTIDRNTGTHMSWGELRELASAGVTIGQMGASHARLAMADRSTAISQIVRATERMTAELGRPPLVLSWPYGEVSAVLKPLLTGLGVRAALGLHSGVAHAGSDMLYLPRFTQNEALGSIDRFQLVAKALPLVVSDVVPDHWLVDRNPPAIGFTVEPQTGDIDQLACFMAGIGRVEVERLGRRLELRLTEALPSGRTRLNCTMPLEDNRWRWFGAQITVN
ncbi:MAG: polysaccharide deacetylase family protein [Alphaproteobacteria bacterium]|nr:polysaccharide deacetylase family protein [Alphaproteobacteria bacterium]